MNTARHRTAQAIEANPRFLQQKDPQFALIERAQAGNQDALEALFSNLSPALYQTALRLVGRSQFSTWLTRIVINAALMRLRSRRSRPAVSLDERLAEDDEMTFADQFPDSAPGPEQIVARRELEDLLRRNLQTLSPVLRSAFILREMEGF